MSKQSSTKASSTAKSLPRLLLDADVNPELQELLQAVGIESEFAPRVDVDIRDDTAILRWARENGYILVRHDKTKDRRTRIELYPEVYHNGGKIIRLGGGPDQDPLVALGRILIHLEEWLELFNGNEGMVVLTKQKFTAIPALALYKKVQRLLDTDQVTGRKVIKPSPEKAKKPRRPPSAQLPLGI